MPISKAQQKSVTKYMRTHYDALRVSVPKGKREIIQEKATAEGSSVNAIVNRLLAEYCGLSMEEWKKQKEE